MGHNTHGETLVTSTTSSPTRLLRNEDQSTNQQRTTSSRIVAAAAEENASPTKVALHPRRPPYYIGGLDEDVHVWASIVDRWFDTVRGSPHSR